MSNPRQLQSTPHRQRPPVTPSQPTLPTIVSTPVGYRATGSKAYRIFQPDLKENQRNMADETKGYWIGPCPVAEFLDEFLPLKETKKTTGKKTKTPVPSNPVPKTYFKGYKIKHEDDIYPHLKTFFNGGKKHSAIAPGLVMADTSRHPDPNSMPGSRIKQDVSVYYEGDAPPRTSPNDFDRIALAIELKLGVGYDILEESVKPTSDKVAPLEANAQERMLKRGQLVTYATEICSRQHRTHLFMVYMFHPYARLIRWDRAGIVISARFNYVNDCTPLANFFSRFGQLDRVSQGYDPTVRLASPEEARHARIKLAQWAPSRVNRRVYKLDVPVKDGDTEIVRQFLVWGALAEAQSPLGRATKGWPAVEVMGGEFKDEPMFLKEQWRSSKVTPEVETLKKLKSKRVQYVPTLVCGGDLPQHTRSHDFEDAGWRIKTTNPQMVKRIERRIHVRFVTKEVGRPLERFNSSKEMMSTIYDAFKGHKEAYEKCQLLHRDVSGGNILILENGKGLLNDWDLALEISELGEGARTGERTGTWPFMSYMLLADPYKTHTVRDDMESFFWVVLYYGLLYLPHSAVSKLAGTCQKIFHDYDYVDDDGWPRGGAGKLKVMVGSLLSRTPPTPFQFETCPPLTAFARDMIELLSDWTFSTNRVTARAKARKDPVWWGDPLQKKHAAMEKFYTKALKSKDWPSKDVACIQLKSTRTVGSKVSNKRPPPDEPSDEAEVSDSEIRVPPFKKAKTSLRRRRRH